MPNSAAWQVTFLLPKPTVVLSSPPWPTRDPRRCLLRAQERLCLATIVARLPAVEDRLPLLPLLAFGWEVGEEIVAEFDIDSDTVGAFIQEEEALLDEMAALISGHRVVRSELAATR